MTEPDRHAYLDGIHGLKEFQDRSQKVRHCKIIGTIGPASSDDETLKELFNAGLDVVRMNFSHGDHETHLRNIERVRRVSKECGRNIAILQDLQGPKIRCGKLLNDQQKIERGKKYRLTFGVEQTDPAVIPIDYRDLARDVKSGDKVMMDDGLLIFKVETVTETGVTVEALEGGTLKNRKGVNFPDSLLSLPALTEKDSKDLLFGIANEVDYVALSFVQRPQDVIQCKKIISALGADIPVIAKIEKVSAVEMIDEITTVADGLMVARGDLGVEGKVERVPGFQRKIIEAAAKQSRPVIIATQMLESMITNPKASMAEVTDVANGVLEGADCLMLSGEVASGKYPVRCVEKMDNIIRQVESWRQRDPVRYDIKNATETENWEEHEAIARAACEAADSLGARAIVCLTLTGSIARLIAKWRPKTPIIAISPRKDAIHRLRLVWGVYGFKNPLFYNTDVLLQDLPEVLKSMGAVKSGETIVITAGIPISRMCPTNTLKINIIP